MKIIIYAFLLLLAPLMVQAKDVSGKIVADSPAKDLTASFGSIGNLTVRVKASDEEAVFRMLGRAENFGNNLV